MIVVMANLPSKVVFIYDGDLLLINKAKAKEVITHATGRTVAEVFEEMFSAGGCGEKTIQNYHTNILTFLNWWKNDLLELTEDDIDDYIFYLQDTSINPTTLNNKLRDLRAFLIYSHSRDWCPKIKINLLNVQEPEIIPLTDEQLQEIYDACMMKKH